MILITQNFKSIIKEASDGEKIDTAVKTEH